jgi:hypothetical protein
VVERRNIDPLKVAGGLWQLSRERYPAASETDLAEVLENKTDRRRGKRRQLKIGGWRLLAKPIPRTGAIALNRRRSS